MRAWYGAKTTASAMETTLTASARMLLTQITRGLLRLGTM